MKDDSPLTFEEQFEALAGIVLALGYVLSDAQPFDELLAVVKERVQQEHADHGHHHQQGQVVLHKPKIATGAEVTKCSIRMHFASDRGAGLLARGDLHSRVYQSKATARRSMSR